ncbi:MAG: FkbM family methyltransferase [Patescibacteria group bacterium]
MLDFFKTTKDSFLGKFLRKTLDLIPNGSEVRILRGPLRGKKWIKGAGVNSYWLGSYENEKVKIFKKFVKKGRVVFDIGANVGYYSLLAANLVGPSGKVFAFEPLRSNFEHLKKNADINFYRNIFPFEVAVSDKSGSALLAFTSSLQSGLAENGNIKVKTIGLDDWVDGGNLLMPDLLKIDVEGAELSVLKGALNILKKYHPIIFLSVHSSELHRLCSEILLSLGYKLSPIGSYDILETHEILAIASK